MSTFIKSFEARELRKRPFLVKIADKLTSFFGSFWFLSFNITFFILWIYLNSGAVPNFPIIDPFPYLFLTMGVSLEAIFLTIVVLISQQRQSQIATIREEIDMHLNKISEKEITKALYLLTKIAEKNGIQTKNDPELQEMLKGIEFSYIERKLEQQLNNKPENIITEVVHEVEKKLKQKT